MTLRRLISQVLLFIGVHLDYRIKEPRVKYELDFRAGAAKLALVPHFPPEGRRAHGGQGVKDELLPRRFLGGFPRGEQV